MLIYQSTEFKRLAQDSTVQRDIEKHLNKMQRVAVLPDNRVPFYSEKRGPYLVGHFSAHNRPIIAELVTVDGKQVLYFHTLFFNHDNEYEAFNAKVRAYNTGDKRNPPPYQADLAALAKWLKGQKPSETKERLPLAPEYEPWLQRPQWETDWVVYEGSEWVSRFPHREFCEHWESLHEAVGTAIDWATSNRKGLNEVEIITIDRFPIYITQKRELWIAFSLHNVPLPAGNKASLTQTSAQADRIRKVIFLLAPFDHQPDSAELGELVEQNYHFLLKPEEELCFDDVATDASKVYPWDIILDSNLWHEIQSEENVHLALSAEEENILLSLSGLNNPTDEYRLPIFINGRAGSGKSTILFYLFREYMVRFLKARKKCNHEAVELKGLPLFLTYNQELLSIARDRVRRMLKTRLLDTYDTEELKEFTNQLMRPFREFLRSLLPKDEPIYDRYLDDARRVTFHEFKRLYFEDLKNPEAKKLSPDLCWYVIRTFIKGYTLEGYLEPEDYVKIPSKEQTIPAEDFQIIHKTVWKWYADYLKNHDLWDDQDLVRVVLDSGEMPKEEYAALFCDESQDFTRLELNLILQASIFSRYDLSKISHVACLPFAFAGDPLQTLNPIGFRWSRVEAIFHDQIIQTVDRDKRLNIRMKHLDDLDYNYRSTRPIVEFSNGILLLRNFLFNQETRPQRFWGKGKVAFPPLKFIVEDLSLDVLRRSLQDTILLIPCDEGGEVDFIQRDTKILANLFPDIQPGKPPKNILSAVSAKGLEFPRIILYKFGENCPPKLWHKPEELKPHERIEAEYFFNKLYVAATRATQRLFVIDSEDGEKKLWSHLSQSALEGYIKGLRQPQDWKIRPLNDANPDSEYAVRAIKIGRVQDMQEMVEHDLERIAKEFMERGISAGNPEYMYRACEYYQAMNHDPEAKLCEAYALKFEKRWQSAGWLFKQLGELALARECFWDGMLWSDLLTMEGDIPFEEIQLAHFMEPEVKTTHVLRNFSDFIADCLEKNRLPKAVSFQWRRGIAEFRQHIEALDANALSKDEWQRIALILENLSNYGYPDTSSAAGQCYANAGDLSQAIRSWEFSANTHHNGYYIAKAQTVAYPQNLEWWEKAGDTEKIYSEWVKFRSLEKSDIRTLMIVAPILEQKRHYWDACLAYVRLPDTDPKKITNVLNQIRQFNTEMVVNRDEIKVVFNFLASRGLWEYLMSLLDKMFQVITKNNERMEIRYIMLHLLAAAKVTDDFRNANIREKIYRSLVRPVKDHRGWNRELDFEVMCAAIEKLGFDMSLRFYESYINDDINPKFRDIARRGWLANAERKIQYHSERGKDENSTLRLRSDYTRRKKEWENLNKITSATSQPPTSKLLDREALARRFGPIKGLPDDIKLNETNGEITYFKVGDLTFTVDKPKKIVKLEDSEYQSIIFNMSKKEIRPIARLDVHNENTMNGKIFSIPPWHMGGRIAQEGEKIILGIEIEGLEQEFTIEM